MGLAGDDRPSTVAVDAAVSVSGGSEQHFDFDIPAQPLAAALQRYASVTSRPALFDSATVSGRTSAALHGRHTPEAALQLLLEGTGLAAHGARGGPADAFVLTAIDASVPQRDGQGVDIGYGARLQARIWEALCADARTVPGAYRALLRFEVDATGALQRPRLLTSTGDVRRDAALSEVLQRVHVGHAPPPAMAQPLTMVLLPRQPGHPQAEAQRCESRREGGRP